MPHGIKGTDSGEDLVIVNEWTYDKVREINKNGIASKSSISTLIKFKRLIVK